MAADAWARGRDAEPWRVEGEGFRLEVHLVRHLHWAMQLHGRPVVRGLLVENAGPSVLEGVTVRFALGAGLAGDRVRLESLAAGERRAVDRPLLSAIPAEAFRGRAERVCETLAIEATADGRVLLEASTPVDLLAPHEWPGPFPDPALLAAFVTPNDPAVAELLRRARSFLHEQTGDPSWNGYGHGGRERARAMVGAIARAVQALGVTYALPPASFERAGQKVRLPSEVRAERAGTCLDIALLLAASFERAGLRPVLVLLRGHAVAGAWLEPEADLALVEALAVELRKRMDLGRLLLVDPSAVVAFPRRTPRDAAAVARAHLDRDGEFLLALDVGAAREERGIRPLPGPAAEAGSTPSREGGEDAFGQAAPAEAWRPDLDGVAEQGSPEPAHRPPRPEPDRRFEQWKRLLLDLTYRNRMLNLRPGRSAARLVPAGLDWLAALEDRLARGNRVRLDPREAGVEPDPDAVRARLERRRVWVDAGPAEARGLLRRIARVAREHEEEKGASPLFLTLGTLSWPDERDPGRRRVAPILLLPAALHRASATSPWTLSLVDEQPHVNPTLLRKLEVDFGWDVAGLDETPEDESGLDVAAIVGRFARRAEGSRGFEVRPEAFVALLAFQRFAMWQELERHGDRLRAHPIVSWLLRGRPPEGEEPAACAAAASAETVRRWADPGALRSVAPEELLLLPLDADASQRSAIEAAVEGASFVLQGPPGTGKSQTIANLVARCLGAGRTVLFVAAKRAALDVVYRRLCQVGLEEACLPLYAEHAKKRRVAERLDRALRPGRAREGGEGAEAWRRRARRVAELGGRLDRVAEAIGRPRAGGLSYADAAARWLRLRGVSELELGIEGASSWSAEDWEARREAVRAFARRVRGLSAEEREAFRGVGLSEWSREQEREAAGALRELEGAAAALERAVHGLPGAERWVPGAGALEALAAALDGALASEEAGALAVALGRGPETGAALERAAALLEERDRLHAPLARVRPAAYLALDPAEWLPRLRRWRRAFALLALVAVWWIRRRLARRVGAPVPPAERLERELADLARIREIDAELEALAPALSGVLSATWRGAETDAAALRDLHARARTLLETLGRLHASRTAPPAPLAAWIEEGLGGPGAGEGPVGAALARREQWRRRARAVVRAHEAWERALDACRRTLAVTASDPPPWGPPDAPDLPRRTADWARRVHDRLDALRALALLRAEERRLRELGLGRLADAVHEGAVAEDAAEGAFERAAHARWLDEVVADDEVLRTFQGEAHDEVVAEFRRRDGALAGHARAELLRRLRARVPGDDGLVAAGSPVHLIRVQARRKRGHLPIRELLVRAAPLLPRVTPCVLANPRSVVEHLDLERGPRFDVVIFDEASQLPTWEAAGAVARGAQLVVVGDSRQLPPTSFFQRIDDGGDGEDAEAEAAILESLLDDAEAAGLPALRLLWHYRSRHQDLIAFSNRRYYEGRLQILPAPRRAGRDLGLAFRHVDGGVYDRGGRRVNRREAEAVAEEVVRRLRDPALRRHSIGIVTFNQAQQRLVENLLEEARARHPEIERFFRRGGEDGVDEPVFVKNLENVQGDERDVVLLSVTYGPDRTGVLHHNFGPLNVQGGQRRLNVAITRARRQLVVFSSIRAEDIDVDRVREQGPRDLREFLKVAERGIEAVEDPAAREGAAGWADVVAEALRAEGVEVHREVGAGTYRMDLAIPSPSDPDAYALGIETDGPRWHGLPVPRDRDRLRPQVLERAGWRLLRVWTPDWHLEPERARRALREAVRGALEEAPAGGAEETEAAEEDPAAPGGEAAGAGEAEALDEAPAAPDGEAAGAGGEDGGAPPAPGAEAEAPPARIAAPPPTPPVPEGPLGVPEDLEGSAGREWAARALVELLEAWGPLDPEDAARRVLLRFGIERMTGRARRRFAAVRGRAEALGVRSEAGALWPPGLRFPDWAQVRRRHPCGEPWGGIEAVPLPDLAVAIERVVRESVQAPEQEVFRTVLNWFGFRRLGSQVRARLRAAVEVAVDDGRVRREGDRLAVP